MSQTPNSPQIPMDQSTSLFGLPRQGRRQSMSRVYQVTTPVSNHLDDDSDDDGIITVDPVTHQTSIMRSAGSIETSKEVLDRLDGRTSGSGRYSQFNPHRASVSRQGSGQYNIYNPNNTSNNNSNISTTTTPPTTSPPIQSPSSPTIPPPPPLSTTTTNPTTTTTPTTSTTDPTVTSPTTNINDRAGRAQLPATEHHDIISEIPELGSTLGSNNHRRPSFVDFRSPSTMRSESVMRTSIKSTSGALIPLGGPTDANGSSDQDLSPTTTHLLPTGVDLEQIATDELNNQQRLQQQQNMLAELNYHYLYAAPALPLTAMTYSTITSTNNTISNENNTKLKNDFFSGEFVNNGNYYTSIDDVMLGTSAPICTYVATNTNNINTMDINTNYNINGIPITAKSILHKSALELNQYYNEDMYLADELEMDELNSILQLSAETISLSNPHSTFKTTLDTYHTLQQEYAQPLFDRAQFQLHSYSILNHYYAQLTAPNPSQLPSRHAYSSIFAPQIFPHLPTPFASLSTNPQQNNVLLNSTTASSTAAGTSIGPLAATRTRYTWSGSHHRQALKKRRMQVLRFALNEMQLSDLDNNPIQQGQQQGGIQGNDNGNDSEEEFDENILVTHYSTSLVSKGAPAAGVAMSTGGTNDSNTNNVNNHEISEGEFLLQQKNARKLMSRAAVPSPNEIILVDDTPIDGVPHIMQPGDKKDKKNDKDEKHIRFESNLNQHQLPLPYSASGVATLNFLSKQLDSRQTKDIMKGKKLLSTLTAAYQEDQVPPTQQSTISNPQQQSQQEQPKKPSLFNINKNKRLHDEMSGVSSTNPNQQVSSNQQQQTNQAQYQQVNGLNYTTPLKSILVNSFSEQDKQSALYHLFAQQQYEELCKKRMRQGCFVIKYKQFQPTRRFLYLSHNDTMLSWRELTSKEEKKFDLWDSMNEEWKECAVIDELQNSTNNDPNNKDDKNNTNNNKDGKDNNNTNDDEYSYTLDSPYIDDDQYHYELSRAESTLISEHTQETSMKSTTTTKHEKSTTKSRWGSFFSNSTTFKSTKSVPIDDITHIFYGPFVGLGFGPFVDQCRKSNAKPWYAATIQAQSETLNIVFLCNYDVTLWLQGLYKLAPSTGKAFTLGKMLWLRIIMKINFIGYSDFVFGTQQHYNQQYQQQLQLQQHRQEQLLLEEKFGPQNNNNTNDDDKLNDISQPSSNTSTTYSSTLVANLKPSSIYSLSAINSTTNNNLTNNSNNNNTNAISTLVPQIYNGGNTFDWSERVNLPGSNFIRKE